MIETATKQPIVFSASVVAIVIFLAMLIEHKWLPSSITSKKPVVSGVTDSMATARSKPTLKSAFQPLLKQGLQPVFQPNLGQFDSAVRYVATGSGYQAYLSENQLSIIRASSLSGQAQVTGLAFLGSESGLKATASDLGSEIHHYYTHGKSVENVPTYGRVHYSSLYNGIDAVFYSQQGQMEYDFKVHPRADPAQIRLKFTGITQAHLADNGDLLLTSPSGILRQHAPVSYQIINGQRIAVESRYHLVATNGGWLVDFVLGTYQKAYPLVIDPVLDYGTYLGGIGNDSGNAIATDSLGNVYVTGETFSTNFPFTTATTVARKDVFVAKIIPDNKQFPASSQRVYVTHLGGAGDDIAHGIDIDANNNVFIVGETRSNDFIPLAPATLKANAYQASNQSFTSTKDAFIARLDASGAVTYMTYFGGDADDVAYGIAVDNAGSVYITGQTDTDNTSANSPVVQQGFSAFPILHPLFLAATAEAGLGLAGATVSYDGGSYGGGVTDAFVAKIDTNAQGLSGLVYSTYLGGNGPSCFPPTGVAQTSCTPLNNTNTQPEVGFDIAIDSIGRAYVVGATSSSTGFPATPGAYQTICGSASNQAGGSGAVVGNCNFDGTLNQEFSDAFLAVVDVFDTLNDTNTKMRYASFLGGKGADIAYGVDVDANGGLIYMTGSTRSFKDAQGLGGFPFEAAQNKGLAALAGNNVALDDAFMVVLRPNAQGSADLAFSSYLGAAASTEIGRDIVLDSGSGSVYVAGESNGQPTAGIIQGYHLPVVLGNAPRSPAAPSSASAMDGFVARFDIRQTGVNAVPFYSLIGGGTTLNSTAIDRVKGVAVDNKGSVYLTGSTASEYTFDTVSGQGSGFMITRGIDTSGAVSGVAGTHLLALQTKCGAPTVVAITGQVAACNTATPSTDAFVIKIAPEADLMVQTIDVPKVQDLVFVGAPYTYTATLFNNNGPETAHDVRLTTSITGISTQSQGTGQAGGTAPFNFQFIPGNLNNGLGCSQPGGDQADIVCTVANIPAGGSQQVSFQVKVTTVGDVTANMRVSASSIDTTPSNNTSTVSNTVAQSFDARVDMVPDKFNVIGGEVVTYAVTVTNDGPPSSGALNVNFPLQPIAQIDYISALPNNALAGSCQKDNVQGTGVICTINNLDAGQSATWFLKIRPLPEGLSPSFFIGGVLVSEAGVGPGQDSNSQNNSSNPSLNVLAGADVSLGVAAVNLGGNRFRYDLTMRNAGPSQAENVLLKTTLPAGLDNPSPQLNGADCTSHNAASSGTGLAFVTCTFSDSFGGPLQAGGVIDWSITVDGVGAGNVPLTLDFNSTTNDPDLSNNSVTKTVNLGAAGLSRRGSGGLGPWVLLGLFMMLWLRYSRNQHLLRAL